MKKQHSYWLAPAATATILLFVLYSAGMFPFGTKTLAWCDMRQQVIPLLMDFKDILSGDANLFFNLQNAGGMSFWGVFLFFLSSPFTFLAVFISKPDLYLFANILVLLKMMTCALTACIFFNRIFKKLDMFQTTALSVMYAFCGYALYFYQNVVWLDAMYLFPLLLLGMNCLIQKGRIAGYTLALSAFVVVNFYLSYMVVLFVVLSFGIYLFFTRDAGKRRKTITLFVLASLLAAAVTAVVWLPSLLQYFDSARTGDLLATLKSGKFWTRKETMNSILLCTTEIVAAIPLYIFLVKSKTVESRLLFVLYILMLIPTTIEPINKMWHTGSYQAFPMRYGYIPIFLGIVLFAVVISYLNREHDLRNQDRLGALFLAMFFVGLCFLLACYLADKKMDILSKYLQKLWSTQEAYQLVLGIGLLLILTVSLITLFYRFRLIGRVAFSLFLCAIVLIEAGFQSSIYIGAAAKDTSVYYLQNDLEGKTYDESLYRVKYQKKYFDSNLIGGLGYNTLNHYTSLTNEDFMFQIKKMGYSSYWMETDSHCGTELTDALMANKYTILELSDLKETDYEIYRNEKYAIIENPYTLGFGVVINPADIADIAKFPDLPRMELQQYLFEGIFQTEKELVVPYQPVDFANITFEKNEETGKYQFDLLDHNLTGIINYEIAVKGKQSLYFDCFDELSNRLSEPINATFNVYVNGELLTESYPSQKYNGLVSLGTFENESVFIQLEVKREISCKSFGIYGMKLNTLDAEIDRAVTADLRSEGNTITGSVYAEKAGSYLFLPITYMDGYETTVNGRSVQAMPVFDSLVAVPLEEGENQVAIAYMPPGFMAGIWISGAGILLAAGVVFLIRRGCGKRALHILQYPFIALFLLLFAAVFFIIYLFPVLAYLL